MVSWWPAQPWQGLLACQQAAGYVFYMWDLAECDKDGSTSVLVEPWTWQLEGLLLRHTRTSAWDMGSRWSWEPCVVLIRS